MKEYTVCDGWDLDEFVGKCNKLIREGWTPQGGMAVAYEGGDDLPVYYTQAFVR